MARNSAGYATKRRSAFVLAPAAMLAVFIIGCDTGASAAPPSPTPAVGPTSLVSPTASIAATNNVSNGTGVLFSDSFESLAAWDVSSFTYRGWSLDPSAGGASPPSAALGPYLNDQEAKMGHVVVLPSGSPIALHYSAWYETEKDLDFLVVWVHGAASADWETLATHSGSSGGFFLDFSVDLSAYAGRDVEIVFGFVSDRRDVVSGGGVRVDDVAVVVGG